MAFRKQRPIVARTAEGYVVRLPRDEIEVLVRLLGELRGLLTSDDPDTLPMMRRLFPPAYHLADDADAEAEYQRFMREELVASRLEAIGAVEAALTSGAPMDEATMVGFMQALNMVRLVLGTLLDVGEHDDPLAVGDDDPMVGEHHLYAFLSWLLELSVAAVSDR